MEASSQKIVAKNTFFLYSRMIVGIWITLISSRILLKALGAYDLGLYSVVAGVVSVLTFGNTSLSISSSRFITYELGRGDLKLVQIVFNQSFQIHFAFSIFFLLIAETIGLWVVNSLLNIPSNRLHACNVVYQLIVISGFLNISKVALNALLIAHEHLNIYATIGISEKLIILLISYLTSYYQGDRLVVYSFLMLFETVTVYSVYWMYCRVHFRPVFRLTRHVDMSIAREMISFSVWSFLGSIVTVIKQHGVNILMNIYYGPIVNAANALAMQVYYAVSGFVTNFTMALNLQVTKKYASGDWDGVKLLFLRGCKFSFFLLMLISYPLLFETTFILRIWLEDVPSFTIIFSKLLTLLMLVEVFNYSIGGAVRATGNIKGYMIATSCILLCCLPITLVIYKIGSEPYTAYVVMIILSAIAVLSRLRSVSGIIKCPVSQFLSKVVCPCLLTGILALIVPSLIHYQLEEGWLRFVLILITGTLSSIICIYGIGCSFEERVVINSLVKKELQKFYAQIH